MNETRIWLRDTLAELIGIDAASIDFGTRFRDLGLRSVLALQLVARLSERLKRPVPTTAPWEHPTPEAFARFAERSANKPQVRVPSTACVASGEPIAIVGMSCRLAGGVVDPEGFWRMLERGVSGVREVPRERWNVDAFLDSDASAPGKMSTRWGGFI